MEETVKPAPLQMPEMSLEDRVAELELEATYRRHREDRLGLMLVAFVLGFALALELTA